RTTANRPMQERPIIAGLFGLQRTNANICERRSGAPGRTRLREHLEGVRLSNRSPRQHWPAKDFRRSVKPPPAPPSRVAPESGIRCPSEPGAGDERER